MIAGRNPKRAVGFVLAAVAFAAALGVWAQAGRWPRRFDVVDPGRLYRSGTVSPGQLERLQREYGLRRVISLLNPDYPPSRAELATARRLGLDWHNVPLTGDGASTAADRERLRALLTADAGPTLVHCAAGVNRTGLAVGMYRLHRQGWPLERVMAELRATDFADLPKHANLRAALAAEAACAAAEASDPDDPPAGVTSPPGGGR